MAELFILKPKKLSKRFVLDEGEFTIGREEGNDLVIPEQKVSKVHAKIFTDQDSFYIQDLKSTNGTLVNQTKIAKVKLIDGSLITIGSYSLKFSEGADETLMMASPYQGDEEEFKEDATLIEDIPPDFAFDDRDTVPSYSADMIELKNYPRLFVISSKDFGNDHLLNNEEVFIGASDDCDIILKQQFVSSKHAKLMMLGDDFTIIDQKSTNGTYVNGKKVKEKKLSGGDMISIGQTNFRYAERNEIFSPAQEQKKKEGIKIPVLPIMIAFLVVLFAGGGYYLYDMQQTYQNQARQQALNKIKKNATHVSRAEEFIAVQKWEEALEEYEKVTSAYKEYDKVSAAVMTVEAELNNRKEYYRFLDAVESRNFSKATSQAAIIPPDSFYHPEAMKRLSEAKTDALVSLESEGKDYMKDDEWEQAIESFEAALQLDPGNDSFTALLDKATKGKEDFLKKEEKMASRQKQQARYRAQRKKAEKVYKSIPDLYAKGKIKEALSACDSISKMGLSSKERVIKRAKQRKALINELVSYYTDGSKQFEQGNKQDAINKWEELLKKEEKLVSSRTSSYYKEIAPKMTDHYAVNADQKYKEKKYPLAYDLWHRALKINPKHKSSKNGLSQLNTKAQELYREGYAAAGYNNIERAKKLWQQVLSIVPPSNEYYKKAQEKLIEYE